MVHSFGAPDTVARNVTRMREERGWSKAELARQASRYYGKRIDPSHITRIENSEFETPRPRMLAALATALNCEIEEITGRSSIRVPTPYETDDEIRDLVDGLMELDAGDRRELVRHTLWTLRRLPRPERPQVQQVADRAAELPDNVAKMPERTLPRWSEEFPIDPAEFNDGGDTDYPLEFHAYEIDDEEIEIAAGAAGIEPPDMATSLLTRKIKEIRDPNLRVIRVRGDSMAPEYIDGEKLVVDVTRQDPQQIAAGEPVAVYRAGEGMILGWWQPRGKRILLEKENPAHKPIELHEGDRLLGPVAFSAHRPARRKSRTQK